MKRIIQIVPKLPPAINGLGDYSLNLARQLRQDSNIDTQFIVGHPTWTGSDNLEGFSVDKVAKNSAKSLISLLSKLSSKIVLLHYVGYGYAQRGCPVWLVDGLEKWRNENNERKLVTMFHELYATSNKPWTSSFWLSALQKQLAVRLGKVSDRCLTSLESYGEIIKKFSQGKHTEISTLPVFSNIGELQTVPPLAKRSRKLLIFGGRSQRLKVYQKSLSELTLACQRLEIKEIIDIGSPLDLDLPKIAGLSIVELGKLSATEISNLLSDCLAGFLNYDIERLAKSTIFAAYCSHGMVSICAKGNPLVTDGVELRKHYCVPDDDQIDWKDMDVLQAIADNACSWYQNHKLSIQTQVFSNFLY